MKHGQIIQVFQNVSMSWGHQTLTALSRDHQVDVRLLEPGQYVVFINSARDKLKVFAANNIIAYYQAEAGREIDLRIIAEIPKVFQGGAINYDKALESMITQRLTKPKLGAAASPLLKKSELRAS